MWVFFFNDTATTEIYTLSLHDALPISVEGFDAFDGDTGRAEAGDLGAHGDQQSADVFDLGFTRGALDHGRALGQDGGGHDVGGAEHGRAEGAAQEEGGAFESGRASGRASGGSGGACDDVAAFEGDLGAECAHASEGQVDGSVADGAPPGHGDACLAPAREPSALFLSSESDETGGAAVFAAMEGSRPVLAEVQALVAPSAYGTPRRSIVGWDSNRLAMLMAVLEARCGVSLGGRDVYLSVAGGYRIAEPAGDLAAAAALLTSAAANAGPSKAIYFGEVALSGAIRPVSRMEQRLKEAARLGFERAFVPDGSPTAIEGLTISPIKRLSDLVELIAPEAAS